MASGKEISPGSQQETPKVQRFQVHPRRSPSTPCTSKVKEYIARVKKADEESRKLVIKPEAMLTLEELYETDERNLKKTMGSNPDLSQTLRALKEKDILISKLRQSCSDLAIKYANAENTIDELRFGVRRLPRRASSGSVLALQEVTRKDVCVETETEVLEEPCVDWLEKVQNWRADETFNPSHEDSCGDSGFRGSELELSRLPPSNHPHIGTQTVALNTVIVNSNSAQDYLRINDSGIMNDTMNSVTLSESQQILVGPSTSQTARTLDALLDDATLLAKRVKEKSMRLAEMLKES